MKDKIWNRLVSLRRIWLLFFLPLSIIILGISKKSMWIAEEIFAKRVFKVVSQGIAMITGWVPFSLAEMILVLGPVLLAISMIVFIIRLIVSKRDVKFRIWKAVLNLFCFLSVAFFIYTIGCGTNYYRVPVATYLGLSVEPSSEEELYNLCVSLANRANEAREQITSVDEKGVYTLSMSITDLAKESRVAFNKLAEDYAIFSGWYPVPKPIHFSRIMSSMELTGIFIPFTMEANVNIDISDYSIASTMCHELAHLRGFIREDEANYIAYLACTNADNIELVYSGLLEALILSGNALYDKNKELYYEVRNTYSDGVNADLNANSLYWKQFENTTASITASKINDTYLKANNQVDGVQSYGRMVDLLLAEYRVQGEDQ